MTKTATPKTLIIKAIQIKGNCPVYKLGEKTIIDSPEINLKKSDKVCVHALFALGTFIVGLREGLDPELLGLAKEGNKKAYFHCLDPGQPYTNGGTVTFEVSQVSSKK
jgi:uncharacterized repeat protein (TIGR04076 family)